MSKEETKRFVGVLRNAGILMTGKGANAVLSLLALAIAARALGAETLGVLVLIQAFTQAIGEIAKFQSWQAVIRYGTPALAEDDTSRFQHLIRLTISLDLVSIVAATVLALGTIWFVGPQVGIPPEITVYGAAYATSVLFMVTATPTGLLRLLDRFDVMAVNASMASLVRVVGGAIAWAAGGGLGSFLIAWYLATALAALHLIGMSWRILGERGLTEGIGKRRALKPSEAFPRFWRFVWSTNANTTVELAFTHVGTLAVGALLGPANAALFRVAKQIADGVAKPGRLLVPAIYPELARLLADGDRCGLRHLMGRSILTAGGVVTLLLLAAALLGRPLLVAIGGAEFEAAYPLMLWLVGAGVIGVWAFPLEPLMISGGRAGAVLVTRIVTAAAYLAGLFVLLDQVGLVGAGWARASTAALMAILLAVQVRLWLKRAPPEARAAP